MKNFLMQTAICFVLILYGAFLFSQTTRLAGPGDPVITSIKLAPGEPVIVPGCKVATSGGYLRPNANGNAEPRFTGSGAVQPEPSDEQIAQWVRARLKEGQIITIYPDKRGMFVTTECQH